MFTADDCPSTGNKADQRSLRPIHKVRGVARSTAPSPPMPAITSALEMFSSRRTSCSCRPSGQDAKASSVVAALSTRVLRSSSYCAPTRRRTSWTPSPSFSQLADNVAANFGVCAGRRPLRNAAAPLVFIRPWVKLAPARRAQGPRFHSADASTPRTFTASTFWRLRKLPPAATKPTPGKAPGPCPSVTFAIASCSLLTKPVTDSRTGPRTNSTPASVPASRSGSRFGLAAVASSPARKGRNSSLSVGMRHPR